MAMMNNYDDCGAVVDAADVDDDDVLAPIFKPTKIIKISIFIFKKTL
jgi:hypothetical protein